MGSAQMVSGEMRDFLSELGRQIKANRKRMGLSQVSASEMMDIDYRHYQNIEGGKINLRLDTLLKLFKFYSLAKDDHNGRMSTFISLINGQSAEVGRGPVELLFNHFTNNQAAGMAMMDLTHDRLLQGNSRLAEILGYKSAEDLTGIELTRILDGADLQMLKDSVSNTLPPSQLSPVIVHLRHGLLPSKLSVLLVPRRASNGHDTHLAVLILDRQGLQLAGEHLKLLNAEFEKFTDLSNRL